MNQTIMNQTIITNGKQFRTSTEIFSEAKYIVNISQSTNEAITRLQELIDTSAYCNLTAKELLAFYQ
jgi:hypothetical protein